MNPKTLLLQFVLFSILTCLLPVPLQAQPQILKDYEGLMEIPDIITMTASPAHMYVLSDRDGLVVFRTATDTLQWLYSSENMQRRGNKMSADVRFGYLYGNGNWLTVLDPTSVLGVYSSTRLPSPPIEVTRLGNYLYIALEDDGLARVSLETPESVDEDVEFILPYEQTRSRIISLTSRPGQLFVLTDSNRLFYFELNGDDPELQNEFSLGNRINRLFAADDELFASNPAGEVFSISPDGTPVKIFAIDSGIRELTIWNDLFVILDEHGRIWFQNDDHPPRLYRDHNGKLIAQSKNQLWLAEYNRLSRLYAVSHEESGQQPGGASLRIAPVENIILPYSQPLLVALELESDHSVNDVQFKYQSSINDAVIRRQGLFWQPRSGDTGQHRFTVIASSKDGQTDSTVFTVDVRSFNAPPRFSPVRSITIAVNESFSLPVKATDPDGTDADLIRYIGVDLPEGATLEEHTGNFSWTPTRQQIGSHEFQVYATDQYGAASSQNINITVRELDRED